MILLLVGTSSSGKTSLARELQSALPGYWQYMALDLMFKGVPDNYGGGANGPLSELGFSYVDKETSASIAAGEIGHRVLEGMIASAVTMNNANVNVVFDDMIIDEKHSEIWRRTLPGIEHLVVRLTAPIDVLRNRNRARNNPPELAVNHVKINSLLDAEMEINTDEVSVAEAARIVCECIAKKSLK